MTTVYEVLGVEPTDEFAILRKAYLRKAASLHPDRNKSETAEQDFKNLGKAWEKLDSPEKAKDYFQYFNSAHPKPAFDENDLYRYSRHSSGMPSSFETSSSSSSSGFSSANFHFDNTGGYFNQQPTDGLRPFTNAKEDVFIPFEVPGEFFDTTSPDVILNPKMFEYLANQLNSKLRRSDVQVGVTAGEALAIINQHSHRHAVIILQVNMKLSDLLDRMSEQTAYGPQVLNAHSGEYLWARKNTIVSPEDILSFSPVKSNEYFNTRRNPREMNVLAYCWPGLEGKQKETGHGLITRSSTGALLQVSTPHAGTALQLQVKDTAVTTSSTTTASGEARILPAPQGPTWRELSERMYNDNGAEVMNYWSNRSLLTTVQSAPQISTSSQQAASSSTPLMLTDVNGQNPKPEIIPETTTTPDLERAKTDIVERIQRLYPYAPRLFGRRHNDRREAVCNAIQRAESLDDIAEILNNQYNVCHGNRSPVGQRLQTLLGDDWERWASTANVKNAFTNQGRFNLTFKQTIITVKQEFEARISLNRPDFKYTF